MRKVIFSSIVIILAGACWVLAQNSASKPFVSPYNPTRPMLPSEKAEVLVAPTTQLNAPAAELSPLDPVIPVAPPSPTATDPRLIFPDAPPPKFGVIPPPVAKDVTPPPPAKDVTPLPAPGTEPSPIAVPNIPAPPAPANTKPPVSAITKPAIAGMPALPPIPGVGNPNPYPTNSVGSRFDGIAVPPATTPPNIPAPSAWVGAQPPTDVLPPPQGTNPVPTQTDPPGYWQERQRLLDRGGACDYTFGPRIWGSVDYLLWFTQRQGRSNQNSTSGQNSGDPNVLSGVRGTLGFWFNQMQTIGFEGNYMWFAPDEVRDSDSIVSTSRSLHIEGGEANFLFRSLTFAPRFSLIAGARYLQINQDVQSSAYFADSTSTFAFANQLDARNQFWGGQVGLKWNYQGTRLFASVAGKIGFGAIEEKTNISGSAFAQDSTGTLLSIPFVSSSHSQTRTAFVPEAVINLGYRFAPWASVSVGYNFLFLSEMMRTGATNGAAGQPIFRNDSFWTQGVNAGLTFLY